MEHHGLAMFYTIFSVNGTIFGNFATKIGMATMSAQAKTLEKNKFTTNSTCCIPTVPLCYTAIETFSTTTSKTTKQNRHM
jgi:hypothetical protein